VNKGKNKMRLQGKVAIVTGSGRGIGRSIALSLAREGAAIVVNDVDADVAESVCQEIQDMGGSAAICVVGVGTKAAADALVRTALASLSGLHILVNNAGITRDAMIHKMTEEQWDEVIKVHLRGLFLNTQAALRVMREQAYGKIINVTSVSGTRGNIGQANYATAKMGVVGFTLTCARELARYKINVNAISPVAATRMFIDIPDKIRIPAEEAIARESVLQRLGTADDVAPLAVFLASDESSYLTGQIIGATGGPMNLL